VTNPILDKPISGDIIRGGRNLTSGDPADFLAELDEIFKHEEVLGVSWRQYTPYFNDGDACIFGVYDVEEILLASNPDEWQEIEELTTDYWFEKVPKPGGPSWSFDYVKRPIEGFVMPAWADAVNNFAPSRYEEALLEAFGDHAQVFAKREGFEIEYYDHD
jgi:hypothetical protein